MQHKTLLELFSGSKSVSNAFESLAWSAISIDNNPLFNPALCIDVLQLSQIMLPAMFNFIWASIPCTTFSRAAPNIHFKKEIISYRNYKYTPITASGQLSVLLLEKTLEIISWFPSALWIIENPVGRIHHFPQLRNLGHYRYYVNYKNFGFDYSKETYLFSNFHLPFATKKTVYPSKSVSSVNGSYRRSLVPAPLIKTILAAIPTNHNQVR